MRAGAQSVSGSRRGAGQPAALCSAERSGGSLLQQHDAALHYYCVSGCCTMQRPHLLCKQRACNSAHLSLSALFFLSLILASSPLLSLSHSTAANLSFTSFSFSIILCPLFSLLTLFSLLLTPNPSVSILLSVLLVSIDHSVGELGAERQGEKE